MYGKREALTRTQTNRARESGRALSHYSLSLMNEAGACVNNNGSTTGLGVAGRAIVKRRATRYPDLRMPRSGANFTQLPLYA